ncbi:transcription termination factor Rho [Gemmatimonas sp. UBA7669]|uniref:transcription termination factor Rho n=1 Tax=Gemmatimonas sp. UBA7669 TaxID=1946568 RepID=UPI0025B9C181|nr:transcription termination factor Rho [Gemmatimonas sp. UBA7669]
MKRAPRKRAAKSDETGATPTPPPAPAASAETDGERPRRPRQTRRPKAEASESASPPAAAPAPRAEPRAEPSHEPRPEPRVETRTERPERPERPLDPRFERAFEPRPEPRPEPIPAPIWDPAERISRDQLEGGNRYDRAFDRVDPPAERNDRPDNRGDRTFNDRRERGGRRRGRNRGRNERFDRPERAERPERPVAAERPAPEGGDRPERFDNNDRGFRRNGRRGRNRFRREGGAPGAAVPTPDGGIERVPSAAVAVEGTMSGWFDPSRDGGFLRRAENSYLPEPTDPFVPPALVRLHQLRRGDKLDVTYGRDHRGRYSVVEVQQLNEGSPVVLEKRPDFNTLIASYPDRKLTLETGRPAKTGPELTRRAIDLIAPIGYGQRALIVAPARAGKTTLLQAIVEGVAVNHPQAVLFVLLVDERPEEVSEMITWGYGEVVASSFDMPPKRHVEVAEMTLERARRLVELGKDVVIVLDSITRLARAHNTVDRGTGRTMSGGLDATAMQKPKAFFGSARMIAPQHGGGSLTIIATALVETGSRMDDVIFEEFKGTGNCEIKLDRSLADRRIFPAFDIATSGTRREEKLYRPDQLDKVHLLRRGLHQLPPQAGMEWLIKRIAATSNNDSLLDGL